MKDFFQEFKEHREKQSITLEEISDITKINVSFLRALEEGDFDILPETYIRLFLRAYAKEIGIDPDEAIEKLEIAQGAISESRPKPKEQEPKDLPKPEFTKKPQFSDIPRPSKISSRPKSTFNWPRTIALVAGFIVIIWVIKSYVSSNPDRPVPPSRTELQSRNQASRSLTAQDVISDQQFAEGQVVDQSQQSVSAINQSQNIELRFDAVARTWMRVKRDTLPNEEYLFLPQDSKTFQAQNRIELRVGNSAGAELTLNGHTLGKLGAANTVTDLVVNRNGVVNKTTVIPVASAGADSTTS